MGGSAGETGDFPSYFTSGRALLGGGGPVALE